MILSYWIPVTFQGGTVKLPGGIESKNVDDVIIVYFDQVFFGFTLPSRMKLPSLIPLGSMGLVYLPLNLQYKSAIHVSKHINHMDPMAAGFFGFTCPKDVFQARSNGNVS